MNIFEVGLKKYRVIIEKSLSEKNKTIGNKKFRDRFLLFARYVIVGIVQI